MIKTLRHSVLLVGFTGLMATAHAAEPPVVHFYNWSDYIAADTLPNFTQQTGIKVTYDVFDTDEVLEAKLLAGKTGFDIVVPGSDFLGRQIKAGVFTKLDKSQIPNYSKLDPQIMALLAENDPGNQYGIPYMWGTTGIGYNVAKAKEILGDREIDSWEIIFNPQILSEFGKCGVAFLNSPTEIYAIALNYLGKNPHSLNSRDYTGEANELLLKIRPHITYFHSSKFISDLANGNICLAVGWSGDMFQARDRAEEAGNGIEIDYAIPAEGSVLWFDIMAIPKDARHPRNAHALVNYLLDPKVMANNSNEVSYANAVPESKEYMDEEIFSNAGIYPPQETMQKMFVVKALPQSLTRTLTRNWVKLTSGK